MTSYFCIRVHFLQPYSHGRDENGEPEWPPSPLRVFQAVVAASAGRWNERRRINHALPALQWLEAQPLPEIVAAVGIASDVKCQFYVPDNTADLLVSAWTKGEITKQAKRTEKVVRPTHLAGDVVHYLYPLSNGRCPHIDVLSAAARSITHLGWGVDMVAGDASIMSGEQVAALDGHRWRPTPVGGTPLRVPTEGTLDDLMRKHEAFLNRLSDDGFRPVPPLKVFRVCGYRRDDQPLHRPYCVFELRSLDGTRFRYPHRKLIHIAGMVRHLAIEAMKASPPTGVKSDWVETFIAGHATEDAQQHRQLSYLPLPSIGHIHADPGVRRIMIVAPPGDDAWLNHLARHLAGQMLEPLRGGEFAGSDRPLLVPVRHDNIARIYAERANAWASVTPVILPGHDDHKSEKTRKLIERALIQSGIEQPCQFEWSAFSRFPKSYPAHKYDKHKRPTGYIRPDHLQTQTAVHLTLQFSNDVKVPGPLAVGAGRHCGLGILAPCP
jgi:CRISPR-associated protein Csb2